MTSTPSTARSSTEYSWLRRFAARRPLTAFLILGMSLGYTLAFIWGLAYYGVIPGGGLADALHIAPDELVGAATLFGLFPAALFVTWASDGRAGVRILLRRAVHWRVSPWWWLTVLFGLPILTVGLALLLGETTFARSISPHWWSASSRCYSSTSSSPIFGRRPPGLGCSIPGSRSATIGSSPRC